MQDIIVEEPYEFVPPISTDFYCWLLRFRFKSFMRKHFAIESVEVRGAEHLQRALDAGQRIMLTPNHSRLSDPMILGYLWYHVPVNLYAMASWHLFKQDKYTRLMIRWMGGFSIYREGNDRQALNTAIDLLVEGKRPLVIFPEGAISRHADILMQLMDGPAFIARQAAKKLAKAEPPRQVVMLPVAIRYAYLGDLEKAITPEIEAFERRFSWQPQRQLSLAQRLGKIGTAMLGLKELEFFGEVRAGSTQDRAEAFVEEMLQKLEAKWNVPNRGEGVIARVKNVRAAILPDLIAKTVTPEERAARWHDLAACYYVQQISHYPRGYLNNAEHLPERFIETIERLEEDYMDSYSYHGPTKCTIQIGEPIPVSPERDRTAKTDPVMDQVATQIQCMLNSLAAERTKK